MQPDPNFSLLFFSFRIFLILSQIVLSWNTLKSARYGPGSFPLWLVFNGVGYVVETQGSVVIESTNLQADCALN